MFELSMWACNFISSFLNAVAPYFGNWTQTPIWQAASYPWCQ